MNKKILSVKPTKNPCKFIFETEMSADELAHLMQAEFPNNYECVVSIKPTGLWKNKLFVTVDESYLDSDNLNTMATILNKKLKAEEENFDWRIECYPEGENLTRIIASSQAAHHAALACQQNKFICIAESRIKPENVTFIWNVKTGEKLWPTKTATQVFVVKVFNAARGRGDKYFIDDATAIKLRNSIMKSLDARENTRIEFDSTMGTHVECSAGDVISITSEKAQLWPRETERLWCIHCKSIITNCDHVLVNTREYAEKLIAHLKAGNRYAQLIDLKKNKCFVVDVDTIKVFNEKNEQLWPRENERLWCVKTKDKTYDVPEKVAKAYLKHLKLYVLYGNGFSGDRQIVDLLDSSDLCNVQYDSVISITDPDGKVVWQKKTYCEIVVAYRTRSLFVTHEDADEVIGWMKRYHKKMCAGEPCPCCCTIHDQKSDVRTSVLLNDIKHIYDENGKDMLADGLAKAQEPKDVWHVEVRRQAYVKDNKFDIPTRAGMSLLDQLQSGKEMVSFYDVNGKAYRFLASSVLYLWNNEKTLWSHENKKPDTTFKAPSLLSRIYE